MQTTVVLFRLNHWCHKPSCLGGPGDIIEISHEDADYLKARKGGEVVAVEDVTPTPDSKNQVKKQEAEEAEALVIAADQRAAADLRAAEAAKRAKAQAES